MVKGKENPTYLNLKKRYDILVNKKAESDQDKIDMIGLNDNTGDHYIK